MSETPRSLGINRRLPSLSALRAFEAASRHLSFRSAGRELNVTQAAVSHQIKNLEQDLGFQLFVRSAQSIYLTAIGAQYALRVRAAFLSIATATEDLGAAKLARRLSVSTSPIFGARWLVPHLDDLKAKYPDLELSITASHARIDYVRGGVDCGIRFGVNVWPNLDVRKILDEETFPVCAPSLLDTGLSAPKLLAQANILHEVSRESWVQWTEETNVPTWLITEGPTYNDYSLVIAAAVTGQGIALGHRRMIEPELVSGQLVQVPGLPTGRSLGYYLCSPENFEAQNDTFREFANWLESYNSPRISEQSHDEN